MRGQLFAHSQLLKYIFLMNVDITLSRVISDTAVTYAHNPFYHLLMQIYDSLVLVVSHFSLPETFALNGTI